MNTYICTDLHGQYNLWKQIKEYLKPDDKLYCLGDCIDRGDDGLQILQEMMSDSRITVLKGNHEDMMCKCMALYLKDTDIKKDETSMYLKNWVYDNGGESTFNSLIKMNEKELNDFLDKVNSQLLTHTTIKVGNKTIFLSHSGFDGNERDWYAGNGRKYNPYLWDRDHIETSLWLDAIDSIDAPKYDDNYYIIHGHTPVGIYSFFRLYWDQQVRGYIACDNVENWKPIHYGRGHKIDLDLGSFYSHMAVLFNANTFEEIILHDNSSTTT